MSIRDLFRRSTQTATAMAVKAKKWRPAEYADFVVRVSQNPGKLHPDTVRTIQAPLATVSDPLVRQICIDSLKQLGSANKDALFASFLSSGDLEAAAALLPPAEQFQNRAADLIALQAQPELCREITSHSTIDSALWCQLFDWAVHNDFELARTLWKRRPKSAAPSEATAVAFVRSAGQHQDLKVLWSVASVYDLPLSRSIAAAVLNGLSNSPLDEVLTALYYLDGIAAVQDAEHAGEVLARNIDQVLGPDLPQLVGNSLLAGIYRLNSSHTVLHVYRHLRRDLGFVPNKDTFQILANAAYRVGNSKITSYHIWCEAKAANGLSRKLAETVLACQLIGPSFHTVFFYLHEMKQSNIYLRPHVQRRLYNKFSAVQDGALVALFADLSTLSRHSEFDMALALQESKPYDAQAVRNADIFLHGFKPSEPAASVLTEMLAFDDAKSSSQSS